MTALCPYGEEGCPDNEGDYDIVMPEPMMGTSGSGYKVRVVDIHDEEDGDCSDEFYLLASEDAPSAGDADGPYVTVTSPAEGDSAEAGEEYTVEVSYCRRCTCVACDRLCDFPRARAHRGGVVARCVVYRESP